MRKGLKQAATSTSLVPSTSTTLEALIQFCSRLVNEGCGGGNDGGTLWEKGFLLSPAHTLFVILTNLHFQWTSLERQGFGKREGKGWIYIYIYIFNDCREGGESMCLLYLFYPPVGPTSQFPYPYIFKLARFSTLAYLLTRKSKFQLASSRFLLKKPTRFLGF